MPSWPTSGYDDITLLAIAYKGAGGGFRRNDP